MCGSAANVPEWGPEFAISAVEKKVLDRELRLKLNHISFDSFEFAIKRYGYIG